MSDRSLKNLNKHKLSVYNLLQVKIPAKVSLHYTIKVLNSFHFDEFEKE